MLEAVVPGLPRPFAWPIDGSPCGQSKVGAELPQALPDGVLGTQSRVDGGLSESRITRDGNREGEFVVVHLVDARILRAVTDADGVQGDGDGGRQPLARQSGQPLDDLRRL